jgi:hypothetical protein
MLDISFYNSFLQIDTYLGHLLPSSELNLLHEVFIVRSWARRLRASVANTLPLSPSTSYRTIGLWGGGRGGANYLPRPPRTVENPLHEGKNKT